MAEHRIASRNARFAQEVVRQLLAAGCVGFVASPGSRNTPLVMAVSSTGYPVEVVLDERSAGFYALGWAKAAKAPVAMICTSGSAGAHYLPAIIEAWESGVPLVAITADRPPEHQAIGAPQTTRQDGFFQFHTKGFLCIPAADEPDAKERLPEILELARLGTRGKPGPIHLNIGFREPLWEPVPQLIENIPPVETEESGGTGVLPELPDLARGLVVAGPVQEAHPAALPAAQALAWTAAQRGWPVLADVASGLRNSQFNSPLLIKQYDLFLRSEAARRALRPEFVLHVGRMPTSKTLFSWMQELEDEGTPFWHISSDGQPHTLAEEPRVLTCGWRQLGQYFQDAQGGRTAPESAWMEKWKASETDTRYEVAAQTRNAGLWEGMIAAAAASLPRSGRLLLASGMSIRDTDTYAHAFPEQGECLVNRGVNGIDGLIATAAGVAAENPRRRVRLLIGDLAFQHDMGSLVLAAKQPNLDIVVINNGGGGIFEFLPIRKATDKFEQFFLVPQNTQVFSIAAGFGIVSSQCHSVNELDLLLSDTRLGCRIIEVLVDRQHNVEIHRRIEQAVIARMNRKHPTEYVDGERREAAQGGVEQG